MLSILRKEGKKIGDVILGVLLSVLKRCRAVEGKMRPMRYPVVLPTRVPVRHDVMMKETRNYHFFRTGLASAGIMGAGMSKRKEGFR